MFRSIPFTIEEQVDKEALKERLFLNREIAPSPDGRFPDCWWWLGCYSKKTNYGVIRTNNKNYYIHRFAAFIFNVNKDINSNVILNLVFTLDSKLRILHHCDNRKCFNPDHLFVGTYQDNANDMKNKNRQAKGEKNSGAKLTENQVLEIRKLKREGWKYKDLTIKFNVEYKAIRRIIIGETWSYLK